MIISGIHFAESIYFWGVARVLVKVLLCLRNDFILSTVQNTPRFRVFEDVGENVSSYF